MTQYSSLEQQVIALAGVVQAARMVDQVAKTGSYPAAFFEASLRSLFVFDAPTVDAVYGNVQGVKLGLRSVVDMLTDATKHIADHAHEGDIVITGDIPLAAKVLGNGAAAIRHNGDIFTSANIGGQLATRDLMTDIRAADPFLVQSGRKGGNAAFSAKDRSRFRNALEAEIRKAQSSGLQRP